MEKIKLGVKRKAISMLLSASMLASMASPAFAAEAKQPTIPMATVAAQTYGDTSSSWGKSAIDRWSSYGVVKGDEKGNFNPNAQMSMAELVTILCNTMGYTETAENTYADLRGDEWYAEAVLKATAAGIIQGDGSNCGATQKLSRERTAVITARSLGIEPATNTDLSAFADAGQVSDWSAAYVKALADAGVMQGTGANSLSPGANINRVSFISMLDKAVCDYVTEPGAVVTGDKSGIVIIAAPNVTLKDANLTSNLILAPKTGAGDLNITGNSKIASITIASEGAKLDVGKDTTVGNVVNDASATSLSISGIVSNLNSTEKADGTSVTLKDGAQVEKLAAITGSVSVEKGANVDSLDSAKADVAVAGTVGALASDSGKTTVSGIVNTLNTNSGSVTVDKGAKVNSLTTSTAKVENSGTISTLKAEGAAAIDNKGTISKAEIKADGVTIDGSKPKDTVTDPGVDKPTDSKGNTITDKNNNNNNNNNDSGTSGGGSYYPDPTPAPTATPAPVTVTGVSPALLHDTTDEIADKDLATDYAVTASQTHGNNYVDVNITANNLRYHKNAQPAMGSWVGFALTAPEDATHFKCSFAASNTPIDQSKAPTPLEANVTTDNKSGVAFYADASPENAKILWATVEWYKQVVTTNPTPAPNAGANASTNTGTSTGTNAGSAPTYTLVKAATTYRMNLDNVKLYNFVDPAADMTAAGITATVTGISTDNNNVTTYNIKLTGTPNHGFDSNTVLNYDIVNAALMGDGKAASYITLKNFVPTDNSTIKQTNAALEYYTLDGGSGGTITGTGDNCVKSKTGYTKATSYSFALLEGKPVTIEVDSTSKFVFENALDIEAPANSYTVTTGLTIGNGKALTIGAGKTLTIDAGKTLTIDVGGTLTNNGTLVNNGTLTVNGTFINNSELTNNGTKNGNGTSIGVRYAQTSKEKLVFSLGDDAGKASLTWDILITAVHYFDTANAYVSGLPAGDLKTQLTASMADVKQDFEDITALDMSDKKTSAHGYAISSDVLRPLTGLTTLNISNTGLTDFTGLSFHKNLTSLNLSGLTGFDNNDFGAISTQAFTTLNLSGTGVTDIGPLASSGMACASSLVSLDISGTSIVVLQGAFWNGAPTLPTLKTLTAENISTLTSISGLVELANSEGFSSNGMTWDFSDSTLTGADAQTHIDQINAKFPNGGGTFTAPNLVSPTPPANP